ncbi:hypothetical protein AB0C69_17160 [Actinomadura sp. NPDC048032]|uniref:hypothetical protein n=1 Tax=Actinomadura sp. NPDC048032 TaxID=3155747 RepID=UPI003405EF20
MEITPNSILRVSAGLLVAAAAATSTNAAVTTGTAAASTRQVTQAPCPSGAVCIYPNNSQDGIPENYTRYGAHDLKNKYGVHLVINNQTGGAGLRFCYGRGGQQCGPVNGVGAYRPNLTPINSIVLVPPR